MATETTKITRMQQRRGLKQDLPKPLRPGEIGFATDSRQIYIGADTVDPVSDVYNKTGVFEKTSSAQSTTASFANVQMIKFTVPHKIYDKGEFDGVTDSITWSPTSNVASSATATQYSRLNKVFRANDNYYKNILTGNVFVPTDLFVVKEGITLEPSPVSIIASGDDYFFTQSGNLSLNNHSHELTFRTAPSGSEAVSISYYGNAAVIEAISNTTIGVTGVGGFYTQKSISSYRQLDSKNIRVTPGTGVGYIGMQFKHIQVATDVKHTPSEAVVSSGLLGTLYLTKNDTAIANVSAVVDGATNVVLTGSFLSGSYNVSGVYNHVYVTGSNDWLDGKVVEVIAYNGTNELTAKLPSNTASLTRSVSAVSNVSNNVQITVGSTQDTVVGDSIYFLEIGGAGSNLHQVEATITGVDTISNTIDLNFPYSSYTGDANTVLTAIVFKGGDDSTVVINSERHGVPDANTVSLATAGSGLGSYTATVTGNADTFIVDFGTNVTSNINALTFTPVISNATVSATPVVSIDLSSASSIADAKTTVNNENLWPRLNNVPGEPTKLYVTHAESVVKTPFAFSLHNDQADTLSSLGLTAGEYTRQNATVKSKLEDWIDSIRDNTTLNLFKEVYVNQEFNPTGHFTTWDLNIDSALGEMNFESRAEARDFSAIVNNLYFESVNPDIRGLINIKTNIEFLTTEALAAGTATTSYTSPEQITVETGNNSVSELALALDDDYQTIFVEYSMSGGTASNTYRRVGTLMYTGDKLAGEVALNDSYTDLSNNVTGNVEFSGVVGSGNTTVISVNNTLTPAMDLSMRYVVRRWGDS